MNVLSLPGCGILLWQPALTNTLDKHVKHVEKSLEGYTSTCKGFDETEW